MFAAKPEKHWESSDMCVGVCMCVHMSMHKLTYIHKHVYK